MVIESPLEEVWSSIIKIEGEGGYCENLPLQHRGLIEELIGGLSIRRSRKESSDLKLGHYANCWNVVSIEPQKHLKLYAELKIPGRATLEFLLGKIDNHTTEVQQLTAFVPRGLFGVFYWYGVLPIHGLSLKNALQKIADGLGQ